MDDMAEFLAQEQAQLGELGIETSEFDNFSAPVDGDDQTNPFGDFEGSNVDNNNNNDDIVDDFMTMGEPAEQTFTDNQEVTSSFSEETENNGFGMPEISDESDNWKLAQQERISVIDANAAKKEAEMKALAKKELEQFLKNYENSEKGSNALSDESGKNSMAVADTPESESAQDWNKISEICNFKASKNTVNRDKMKSLILNLKEQPLIR